MQETQEKRKHLLLDTEVAEILGASISSVRKWRLQGRGPRFVRLGGAVRYRESDVLEYVESGRLYTETGIGRTRSNRGHLVEQRRNRESSERE